jgi:hypothetical protein
MIVETLALGFLTAAGWSDADRSRAVTRMVHGQWDKLLTEIGPERYLHIVMSLPRGKQRDRAVRLVSIPIVRAAFAYLERFDKSFTLPPDWGERGILVNPSFDEDDPVNAPEGRRGFFVSNSVWMSLENVRSVNPDAELEWDDDFTHAARELLDDGKTVRFSWDTEVHHRPEKGAWVSGWFWVDLEDALREAREWQAESPRWNP